MPFVAHSARAVLGPPPEQPEPEAKPVQPREEKRQEKPAKKGSK